MITKSKPQISFYTLGCRLNQAETASLQNSFEVGGYTVVDFAKPADIVVINTCTVTENGDADTRRLVNKISRSNPHAKIALIGCQAQMQKEKLAILPNVRWIVGNAKKMDLLSIFEEWTNVEGTEARVIMPAFDREPFTIPVAAASLARRHERSRIRANLKIQDGCDFFCSFCEISYARGRARSREFDNILLEAHALVAAGHKEIVLTGINVGTYQYQNKDMLDVIDALEQIDGLERIRISSIEPTTIPHTLIKKMAGRSKLCRYLHIPMQSGHNAILTSMKRKYTVEEFAKFIHAAYNLVPEICIGTDVIVGFPGETDEFFTQTYENLRKWPIHYFHVFSYSARTMAKSKDLPNTISPTVIHKRSEMLRNLSQRKRRLYYHSLLGTTQKVLFEQKNEEGYWDGVTDHYVRVKVRSNQDLINTFADVRLVELNGQAVIGQIQDH